MNRLIISDLPLAGLKLIERRRLGDDRGVFARLFCADELRSAGWTDAIAQVNHTLTAREGTVRGMHFQRPPHAEIKLVSCVRGEVFDVAVDLRRASTTFLHWHAERLSADNGRAMLIPKGFAHGVQSLSDAAELIYCHSAAYDAASEGGRNPRDPRIAIAWPQPLAEMSARDAQAAMLDASFAGIAP